MLEAVYGFIAAAFALDMMTRDDIWNPSDLLEKKLFVSVIVCLVWPLIVTVLLIRKFARWMTEV